MSEISSVRAPERPAAPSPADLPAPVPEARTDAGPPGPSRLEPAVTVDVRPGGEPRARAGAESDYQARFVRDADTQQIVFRVVDPASGSVVEQLPSVQALKERAYSEARARAAELLPVTAESQRPLDVVA
ncbi:hypothetical protein [Methylobacterium nigriterrae]|uniref:hypothetical protein n=1 Tax=Methylobacterium nigriterrae TaxID=3127512 RepID=UPI0030138401